MSDGWIDPHVCRCGSGHSASWFRDARGIELFKGCDVCAPERLRSYRPDVLTDSQYWTDEEVEAD
jgi:hypothetical protein